MQRIAFSYQESDRLLSITSVRQRLEGASIRGTFHSCYYLQVKRYLELFGREQLLILFFRAFGSSPGGSKSPLAEVFAFLNLDPGLLGTPDEPRAENEFAIARWNFLRRLAGSRYARRIGQTLVPARFGSTYKIKRLVFEPLFLKRAQRPAIDPRAIRWLRDFYDRDVTSLEHLLGQTLPELRSSWSLSE